MLENAHSFSFKTRNGETVDADVNYSDNAEIKDCQYVKFKFGDKEFEIKREELMTLLLAIGEIEDVQKLLPCKVNQIKQVERMLTFEWKATHDIKKDDIVRVNAPWIDTAITSEEILSGNFKKPKLKDKVLNFFK